MRHGGQRKETIDLMFSSDIPIIVVILAALFLAMGLFYSIRMRSFDARLQAMLAKLEDMNAEASRHRGLDRKSTRLNSSHIPLSRMPSSA